ncbi:8813_t:CDS:2, partial [Funneliformis caledonium]
MVECIEDFGPCRGYWQFPMERMCGMLIPLVKSQIHPYANLWNNLILNERFNHLKYKTKFYKYIFPDEKEKEWPSHRVYTSSLYEEYEFYSPSKKYVLTSTELKKLKEAYSAIYDLNINQIEINITIDMDAYRVNASQRLVIEEIFGEIEYFIINEYNGSSRMFAYIRKIDKYKEDNYGQIYFNKFNGFQFIEVI